jgi:type I restriction enzyme, S subunit
MKDKPKALTPKLRFPEFGNDGPWSTRPLDELCDRIMEKVGDVRLTTVSITAGRGFVSQAEKFGRDISGAQYKNYIRLRRGEFAYNKGNSNLYPEGCVYQLKEFEEAAASNAFICFRLRNANAPGFFDGLFEKNAHGRQLLKFLTSGARSDGLLNINADEFFSVNLPVPPRPAEQRKIAQCLTSLDQWIAADGRKLEALRAHKKGLKQQLFPREGESRPRLRFPEFRDAPEWETPSIRELIDTQFIVGHLDGNHGELYPRSDEFSTTGVPYITANDFKNGYVDLDNCKRLPEERALKFTKGVAKDGDILFAHNATVGPVAKLNTSDEFVILSTTATYFRCNQEELSNDFLRCALEAPSFVEQYTRVMSQSTRDQVPITAQRRFFLQIPKLPEQHRIAACLSSLDTLIAAQSRKLDGLRAHKKGLMQQLFPLPEEL